MGQHTNVAQLVLYASKLLQYTGRLQEHELWDGEPLHRLFIERDMADCAKEIADWFGCDLVERQSTPLTVIMPYDADEEAA